MKEFSQHAQRGLQIYSFLTLCVCLKTIGYFLTLTFSCSFNINLMVLSTIIYFSSNFFLFSFVIWYFVISCTGRLLYANDTVTWYCHMYFLFSRRCSGYTIHVQYHTFLIKPVYLLYELTSRIYQSQIQNGFFFDR